MKKRPIIFSGPMVRAILAGRKTQTRRPISIKTSTGKDILRDDPGAWNLYDVKEDFGRVQACFNYTKADYWQHMGPLCRYGQPGDWLWVREAFTLNNDGAWCYRATDGLPADRIWCPSIHMPKTANRITLEIVNVRVERLQDISDADAIAEGIGRDDGAWQSYSPKLNRCVAPATSYQTLWESINGPGSWDANPWVWVVEFKRIKP